MHHTVSPANFQEDIFNCRYMPYFPVKDYKRLPRGETTSSLTTEELLTKNISTALPSWFNPNRNLSIHLSQTSSSGGNPPIELFQLLWP